MRITDMRLTPYMCTRREPLGMAFNMKSREESSPSGGGSVWASKYVGILIEVETDEGITGIAPAVHLFGLDVLREILAKIRILVLGENPFHLEKMIGSFLRTLPGLWGPHTACIAFAGFEMACWDIMGKKLGVPISDLIGGNYREKIPITAMLGIDEPDLVAGKAVRAVENGIKTIKIKVGLDPFHDVEVVGAVRKAVGKEITIRVDANQAWTVPTAIRQLRKIAEYDLEFIEQPIPAYDYDGLAHIRAVTGVPTCICEGLYTINRAIDLVRKQAVDYISTDPFRMGGITQLLKLCGIAEAAGIHVVSHWSVENLATAVWLHWLASSPVTATASDLTLANGVGASVQVDSILTEPIVHKSGSVTAPDKPGIGVDIDRDKLRRQGEEFNHIQMESRGASTAVMPSLPRY